MRRTRIRRPLLLTVLAMGGASLSSAQEARPPKLEYVMTYQADLAPPQVVAPNRLVFGVTGGWLKTADGARGELLQPCADWAHVLPSGTVKLDIRCTVKMDDGALLYIEYTGRLKVNASGAAKSEKGEPLGPDDLYFFTSPTVETTSEKYAWMNDAVFVNKAVAVGANSSYVRYDTYKLVP